MIRVGVISDTHGLLRPEALAALRGVDRIVHAGDVGTADVLEALERIAPVVAVRGNNDHGRWADALPEIADLELAGRRLRVIHDRTELRSDPVEDGFACVIAGHSHRPRNETVGGVLWLNPGSAGPRRFSLPISLALLEVPAKGLLRSTIVELVNPAPLRTPKGASGRGRSRR